MCGISVLLDRSDSPGSVSTLLGMHEPIRHRGPDGEGFALVDATCKVERFHHPALLPARSGARVGLGFRRLKILDLSEAADQPMASPDGQCWMVYNGEIYNYQELRRELEKMGRVFATTCDSEVALAAYEAWGERAFERLDGMWALAIVDLRRRRLVASRDRFGIKPLYWRMDGARLLLASEIKQLLGPGLPSCNPTLVGMYLRGARYPCLEETFFEGVRAVPPATWFEIPLDGRDVGAPRFVPYWSLADYYCPDSASPRAGYRESLETFRGLLASAVASHHVADVTVGSLLSGGLDSAVLTSYLVELTRSEGRDCPTFSFGFGEAAPRYCELRYAQALVQRDHLTNYRTTFDAAWVVENTRRVVRALEEPPLAMAAAAQYRVFELCREHGATVVLDGEGSDEILGGYPYYQRALLLDHLRRGRLAEFGRELRAMARRQHRGLATLVGEHFLAPLLRRARRDYDWIAPAFRTRPASDELAAANGDRGRDPSVLNRQLYAAIKWGNIRIVLPYTDKNAMAHSVEARVPFFDRRLVEFAFSLPERYKVGNGDTKRILRDVGRERLPREITERPDRMGFGTPDAEMLRGPMWPAVRQAIGDRAFLSSACLESREALRFVDGFAAGRHQDHRAIWRLWALAQWAEAFGVKLP